MYRTMTALTLLSIMAASAAQAAGPSAGDVTLSFTDVTSDNSTIAATGPAGQAAAFQPTYNIGFFVTDDLMPYGSITSQTIDDTAVLLRGGTRYYLPLGAGNMSTFAAGELTILSSDASDATGLGGFVGAEYFVTPQFGISGRVGLRIVDPDRGDTITRIGAADMSVNFYF